MCAADLTAILSAAQQYSTVVSYSQSSNVVVSPAVADKQEKLLTLMSNNINVKDPGSATSCLNAASAAASTKLQPTATAGLAYINIVKTFLSAISLSTSTAYSATSVTVTQVREQRLNLCANVLHMILHVGVVAVISRLAVGQQLRLSWSSIALFLTPVSHVQLHEALRLSTLW